ncbi:MAG: flagellar hook-associated protein FlgK [Gammaproteobacteria bacterium]|jgi:flagellar hook-associated protein 1 FlgK
MSLLLNNAISGLLTAQRGMDTTSHNIANVNTEGYSRQRVDQAARVPQFRGSSYVGTGVDVTDVRRIYDQFLTDQLRGATAAEQELTVFRDLSRRVDSILSDEAAGLSQGLSEFFETVESLTADPASLPIRYAVLGQGQALADRFGVLDAQLGALENDVNLRIQGSVSEINGLAGAIARVNDQISRSPGQPPSDLLDQRDALLSELAGQIDVSVIAQPDGALNIFVGSGQALVAANRSFDLAVVRDEFDPTRLQVAQGDSGFAISGTLSGGALGGALEFRRAVLDPARQELGRIATGLAESFNAVHRGGMDLASNAGEDFFKVPPVEVLPSGRNLGNGAVVLGIADFSALAPESYELAFAGGSWQLTNQAGSAVPMSGSGTALDPFQADGLSIEVPAGAVDGDRFLLRPLARAAGSLGIAVGGPERIAAASPLGSSALLSNQGNAVIGTPAVTDPSNPALSDPVSIVFDDPATFRVLDAGGNDLSGPLSYSDGGDIDFNGWRLNISGQVEAGDRFDIAPNPAGVGDNTVAQGLAGLVSDDLFEGGLASLRDLEAGLLSRVGVTTRQAGLSLDAQTALREQTALDVQSVSGVNLDEEAINLMRYQEAYMAAAKAISVADSLFQSILDAMRG